MRVAVVHDWLVAYGGAERTLASMLRCYPQAEVFTLLDHMAPGDRAFLKGHRVHTSFLQNVPFSRRHYRRYLPLMPLAIESLDLSGFDLVLSSSFCVAKGVITGPEQLHVSYVHSPMRYAWDMQHEYLREANLGFGLRGLSTRLLLQWMRSWDARSSTGIDALVANSEFVARRIQKCYRREAKVVNPPVDVEYYRPGNARGDYYVTVSRLVPYKRVDQIVEAFARMPDRKLVVIGDGPELARIKSIAGPNVSVMGHQPASVTREYLQGAKAFIFAAKEDFGIAPVEAQACGTPVIAFGAGGALETVIDGRTGLLYSEQSAAGIADAVAGFEALEQRFDSAGIRAHATKFSEARFRRQLVSIVDSAIEENRRIPGAAPRLALSA